MAGQGVFLQADCPFSFGLKWMKTALPRLFFALLLLAGRLAPAQVPATPARLDSLRALAARPGLPDTTRARYLWAMARQLYNNAPDSALRYGQQSLVLARRAHHPLSEAYALSIIASSHYNLGHYPLAQRFNEQSLVTARQAHSLLLIGRAYLGLGTVAEAVGDQAGALGHFEQALAMFARCRPRQRGAEVLTLSNLGNAYLRQNQTAPASRYLRQAQRLADASVSLPNRLNLLDLLGLLHQARNHPDSAVAVWQQELRLARRSGQKRYETYALGNIGGELLGQHQPDQALPYVRQALALARQQDNLAQTTDFTHTLAQVLHAQRRLEAFDTLLRAQALYDTLSGRAATQAVAEAQARFNGAEKQARITVLEKDRRIQALEAERRATRTRLLATGGTLAAGLLLAGVVLGYRRRQRRLETQLRERLAADLHDDLSPLLTQLAVESSLLRENVYAPDQLLARLQHLGETSQRAAQHLGTVLRDLDQGPAAAAPAPLGELVNELREQAHEALSPHQMGLTLALADPALAEQMLPAATRHALALIFREALHNVVKHAAGAVLVRATLAPESGGLLLALLDDGHAAALATARPGGRGLRNMRTRAEALGGWCEAGPASSGYQVRAWLPG
jgi:signal transduction histidine kinase